MTATRPPSPLATLTERFDPSTLELGRRRVRVRLAGATEEPFDVILDDGTATLEGADATRRPDALLTADAATWSSIADDLGGSMTAFRAGRLSVRHDLHLGVGFLAATANTGAWPSRSGAEARRPAGPRAHCPCQPRRLT